MPQIQYPPIAYTPGSTDPPVASMGWWSVYPDTTKRSCLPVSAQPFGVNVFAVEQWTPPLGAASELPDDTRLGRRTPSFAVYPHTFRGEAVEQFAPTLGWPQAELPDNPELFVRRRALSTGAAMKATADSWPGLEQQAVPGRASASYPDATLRATLPVSRQPYVFRGESLENFAPTLFWSATYPDTTKRAALATGQIPWVAWRGEAPEQFAATLLWSATYPDRTCRAALSTATLPFLSRGEAVEQFAVPPSAWAGSEPDRYPFARPQTRIDGLSYSLQDLVVVVPALSWRPTYADTTRRSVLPAGVMPSVFRGEALEQFAVVLLASATYPDRVPRALPQTRIEGCSPALPDLIGTVPSLSWKPTYADTTRRGLLLAGLMPSVFRGEAIEQFAPTLQWSVISPDGTRRASLAVGQLPWTAARGEAPEQFAPTLQWSARYPDATRRAMLSVADVPFLVRPEALLELPPTLLWSATYPDVTKRASLGVASMPAMAWRPEALRELPATLQWLAIYPERTRRTSLAVHAMPFLDRPEAILELPPTLQWSARYPDTTRRASLAIAAFPSKSTQVFLPPAVPDYLSVLYPATTRRRALAVDQMPAASYQSWACILISAVADVRVHVQADVDTIAIAADVDTVHVRPDVGEILL